MERRDAFVSVVRAPRQTRDQLVHHLDGRYGALRPTEVQRAAEELAGRLDLDGVDIVVAIPEGGIVPAFAVAQIVDLPVAVATRTEVDLRPRLTFREPHVPDAPDFHLYRLPAGLRAVIVEDEVTTGRTAVNAVRALRSGGLAIDQVGAFIGVDHPSTRRRLRREAIRLEVLVSIDASDFESALTDDS